MKKLVLGAAAAAVVAAPLALMPTLAGATGSTTPSNSVTISSYADYGLAGTNLDIGLQVSCTGGSGIVEVEVDQYFPETPLATGAHGLGATEVVCDGKNRYVTATIAGVLYDGGKAKATATLVAPTGTDVTTKWITIRAH